MCSLHSFSFLFKNVLYYSACCSYFLKNDDAEEHNGKNYVAFNKASTIYSDLHLCYKETISYITSYLHLHNCNVIYVTQLHFFMKHNPHMVCETFLLERLSLVVKIVFAYTNPQSAKISTTTKQVKYTGAGEITLCFFAHSTKTNKMIRETCTPTVERNR